MIFTTVLQFPNIPASSIVYADDATPRDMFLRLYEKYLDDSAAEWRVDLSEEIVEEITIRHRRCTIWRAQSMQSSSSLSFADSAKPPKLEIIHSEEVTHLRPIVEALDNALCHVIKALKHSFSAYQATPEYRDWLASLKQRDLDGIERQYQQRRLIRNAVRQTSLQMSFSKWQCSFCTMRNRAIQIGKRRREPQSKCDCCGAKDGGVDTLEHTHSLQRRLQQPRSSAFAFKIPEPRPQTRARSKSYGTNIIHTNNSPLQPKQLDTKIASQWRKLLLSHAEETKDEDSCTEYVDSCLAVRKLHFVMRHYHYFLGKACAGDEDQNYGQQIHIESMAELVGNLKDFGVDRLLDAYHQLSN